MTTNDFPSPQAYRWVVLGIVMIGTFMAILDSSIVNVALPHMMSAFGVSRDQIEWVSTAYMLSMAVVMPLVGWTVGRFGHKALYLSALALFTLGSAACALSWSYNSLIVARIAQAIGCGAIQPVGMAIVADLFAPHERGKALGIWGTGIMAAPAFGPTLGGYLIDTFSWRTIFSINLPIGLLALMLGAAIMKRQDAAARKNVPFDYWGFIFLSMALISGLLALSQGQEKGWDSPYVHTCLALTIIGGVMFIGIESASRQPLLDLSLFRSINFTLSIVLALFRAVGLFGSVFLLPIFLQSLVGYTTVQTGLWMMPGAIAVGFTMPIAGRLADRCSPRWLVAIGTFLTGFSLLQFGHLEPLSDAAAIIVPQVTRGVGLALMMAPLLTVGLNSVPRHRVPMASSFLTVAQSVGGSFGIALLNTYVTNSIQRHAVRIGELIGTQTERFSHFALHVSGVTFRDAHGVLLDDRSKGLALSAKAIVHRASVLGFDNGFVLGGLIVLSAIPLCLLLKRAAHPEAQV